MVEGEGRSEADITNSHRRTNRLALLWSKHSHGWPIQENNGLINFPENIRN